LRLAGYWHTGGILPGGQPTDASLERLAAFFGKGVSLRFILIMQASSL
jgi:hypothetical protein